jgi:hypothetical protein
MSKVKNVVFDIQNEIRLNQLPFRSIAEKHDVPVYFVEQIWEEMCETEFAE